MPLHLAQSNKRLLGFMRPRVEQAAQARGESARIGGWKRRIPLAAGAEFLNVIATAFAEWDRIVLEGRVRGLRGTYRTESTERS